MKYKPEKCIVLYGAIFSLVLKKYHFKELNRIINKRKKQGLPFIRNNIASGKLMSNDYIKIISKDFVEITIYYQNSKMKNRTLREGRYKETFYFEYVCDVKKISKYYEKMKDGRFKIRKGILLTK